MTVTYKVLQEVSSKLEIQCKNVKRACIFHLLLVGIPSVLILSVKNKGSGGLINGQNLLSMAKFICQQSLIQQNPKHSKGRISSPPNWQNLCLFCLRGRSQILIENNHIHVSPIIFEIYQ